MTRWVWDTPAAAEWPSRHGDAGAPPPAVAVAPLVGLRVGEGDWLSLEPDHPATAALRALAAELVRRG